MCLFLKKKKKLQSQHNTYCSTIPKMRTLKKCVPLNQHFETTNTYLKSNLSQHSETTNTYPCPFPFAHAVWFCPLYYVVMYTATFS